MTTAIPSRGKARRNSSTRFSSPPALSRLPSSVESPQNLCPQDTEAFAFKPEFLQDWAMDKELWKQLPANMYKVIIAVQHAGAAVFTSVERLEKLDRKLPEEVITTTLKDATASDAIAAKLHEHQAHTTERNRSYTRDTEEYNCSPIPTELRNFPSFSSAHTADSSGGTNSTGYFSPVAQMSPPSLMSLISGQEPLSPAMTPFDLGEARLPTISRRDSDAALSRSVITRRDSDLFSISHSISSPRLSHSVKKEMPRDPASNQYYAELEHLRKVALVRLRHATRPIDFEFAVAKYDPPFAAAEDTTAAKQLKEQFELWWIEKKMLIAKLDERGKDLCAGVQFSLGWSDAPGLDHSDAM
jgi:hypothetical protein